MANAQESTSEADGDEGRGTIIVIGTRAERELVDTPDSVVVLNGKEIEARQADRVEQLLAQTPNVQLGSGEQGPAIRGQNATGVLQGADAFLGGTRPRATIRLDGRDLGFNELIYGATGVWDVDRVEIFRTPQTTTQGRNSIAGAIFIQTADPTYEFEGRARALVGNYDTLGLSGVVSGPIVADQLAARVAVDYRESRAQTVVPDFIDGVDERRDDFFNVRAKLLAEPEALPGLRLEFIYAHTDTAAPQADTVREPFEDRANPEGGGGLWRTDTDSITAVVRQELGGDSSLAVTTSYGDSVIRRLSPPGQGVGRIDVEDFAIEVIASRRPAEGIGGVLGISYLTTSQTDFIDLTAFLGNGDFTDDQESYGIFGEVEVTLAPRFSITLGGRYQNDSQDRDGFLGTSDFGFTVDYDRSFDAFLPKAALTYELSDDATIGLLVQRAYNPGGTTISFETGQQDTFGKETLWNYEAFLKAALLDGRLRLGLNSFYADFDNAQRPQTFVTTRPDGSEVVSVEIDNAPEARTYGLEAEVDFSVTPRFRLGFGIGLLDTEITQTLDPTDPILGNEFERAPKFSAAASVNWEPLDRLNLNAQIRHNAGYFSDDANTRALAIGDTTVVDARVSYGLGPLTLFAYGRNLLDEFYLTQLYTPDFGSLGEPQEYGVGVEARF
ncbi:TonB-dependent receptor [Qipengyuania qiaonensis]|uniref:TonB-dependent receptor n=1 Tax=Qipengyuania qiaonensis TaxID=2867240 RepID=A0ABS7JCC7_9SPHN|nr:TonB-dependent receptor [Qipengyuania qiaonensis]MBX7483328.1 TonB-dependent receptor [Qipengyuania qiaonensis]